MAEAVRDLAVGGSQLITRCHLIWKFGLWSTFFAELCINVLLFLFWDFILISQLVGVHDPGVVYLNLWSVRTL